MQFTIQIPDAMTMKVGKESYRTLDIGTFLHRLHPTIYESEMFNPSDKGNARFSPIRDAAANVIPTIYGAESFECATCEIILRCPDSPPDARTSALPDIVYPADFRSYSHSVVQTTADLILVDITIAGQRKLGVNHNALLAGPRSTYPNTRSWAERIHATCPSAQGLYYLSYQYAPHFAVVLFGDRIAAGVLLPVSKRAVADSNCHEDIRKLADALSIEYEDL